MDNSLWVKMHGGTTHFPIALVMGEAHTGSIMQIEVKGTLFGLAAALGLLGVAFGLSPLLRPESAADAQKHQPTNTTPTRAEARLQGQPKEGCRLFDHNCAP